MSTITGILTISTDTDVISEESIPFDARTLDSATLEAKSHVPVADGYTADIGETIRESYPSGYQTLILDGTTTLVDENGNPQTYLVHFVIDRT